MHAVRQKCRPKHQVLVLKCYPRHQKNIIEIKPNSSELSYLLYYASTRRSKLQKVGDFLDKRTTSDVWKGRIGNVQVTLQILKALIEKTPRDLPLYSSAVLRIFRTIIRSYDVTMIEETLPAFETFCAHQDPATLAADQDFIRQYEEVIRLYAAFASKESPIQSKTAKSVPVLIRFRKAGLEAIGAIASSEILSSETAKQLSIIVPVILENIYSENGHFLNLLERGEEEKVEMEKEFALRRRQSTNTVRTPDVNDADPVAASVTIEAADKLAEEETAIIALRALKRIYSLVPRGQLRLATEQVLKFMTARAKPAVTHPAATQITPTAGSWPCTLFFLICGWAPVQDRYIVLVTIMETLIRSPVVEDNLEKQFVLATVVAHLLSSDINFIGLSVMDVLVGLIQHILLVLQLGGHGSLIHPHHQQTASAASGKESVRLSRQVSPASPTHAPVELGVARTPSPARLQLLAQLQRCIGSLAVHIYYSDQISDMISAILFRLKPSHLSSVSTSVGAIQDPAGAADAIASSANLSEKPNIDGFFSFDHARVAALESIKEIIAWANWTKRDGSPDNTVRGSIDVEKWEGTQWLLRDPNWNGRVAYVEALLIWMKYEFKKSDLRVPPEQPKRKKGTDKKENGIKETLARRAVSNASYRDKSPKRARQTFLQLLHLAVYESAQQHADSECDILLLHLLLTQLVQKLGVNAAQHGLPMIMRLQEDIPTFDSAIAKINIGSLVHGYLWALSVHFNFDAASIGREIQNEISRRINHKMWLQNVRVPSLNMERIVRVAVEAREMPVAKEIIATEALKPCDKLPAIVQKIAEGYSIVMHSPPTSPPGSPSRSFSNPILGTMAHPSAPIKSESQLPQRIKDILVSEWSREDVIATTTARTEGSQSGSLQDSGSPTNGQGPGARHLAVVPAMNGSSTGPNSDMHSPQRSSTHGRHPHYQHSQNHMARGRPSSAVYGLIPGNAIRDTFGTSIRPHSRSVRSRKASRSPTQYTTTSSVRSAVRVEDLKRILSGGPIPFSPPSRGETGREHEPDESGSESMISYEGSDSSSAVPANDGVPAGIHVMTPVSVESGGARNDIEERNGEGTTEGTITPQPLVANASSTTVHKSASFENGRAPRKSSVGSLANNDIPPVPPLPPGLSATTPSTGANCSTPQHPSNLRTDFTSTTKKTSVSLSGPQSITSGSDHGAARRPRMAVPSIGAKSEAGRRDHHWRKGGNHRNASGASHHTSGAWSWNPRDLLDDIDAEAPGTAVGLSAGGKGVSVLGGRPPY